ncbi:MAG: bluetail domain-containing putative surface protein, partial [Dolichospermum sp.]
LTNNVENLTLTGAAAINGTGNTANNVITGNSANNTLNGGLGNDTLNGGAGADILTGGVGSDIFVFQFGQSPVSGADRITDFAIGTDRIDLLSSTGGVLAAPTSFARAANSTATTLANVVNSVFTDANGALTGNQALGVNSAALVNVTTTSIAGTYLMINDGVAGFQSSNDLLVNITGYTGTLPDLGNITVANFFI